MASDSESGSEFSLMDEDDYVNQQQSEVLKEDSDSESAGTFVTSRIDMIQDSHPSEMAVTTTTEDMVTDDVSNSGIDVQLNDEIQQLEKQATLEVARKRMHSIYPLTEVMWRQWIDDTIVVEQKRHVTVKAPWLNDNVDLLYKQAIEDYMFIGLWHDRIARIQIEIDKRLEQVDASFDVNNSFISEIQSQLLDLAVDQVMYHVTECPSMDLVMDIEVSILEKVKSTKQFERIRSMFLRRLSTGHAGTFSRLSPLVTEYCAEQYESIMVDANQKKQQGDKAYMIREPFETQLVQSGYNQHSFDAYIAFEKQQRPPSLHNILMLYERALIIYCLNPLLWEQYLLYTMARAESNIDAQLALCQRTVRNCPWSGNLWEQSNAAIVKFMKTRLSSVMQSNKMELVKLSLAYCSWERRRYVAQPELGSDHLSNVLSTVINQLDTLFPEGDATNLLLEFAAQVYASTLNNVDMGRQCWLSIIKKRSVEADAWLGYVQFERQYGDATQVQSVFKQACFRVGDWPERIFSSWIAFEQQHGTADSLTVAYARTCHQAAVLASRLDQAQQMAWIEQEKQRQKQEKIQEAKALKKMQADKLKEEHKRKLDNQDEASNEMAEDKVEVSTKKQKQNTNIASTDNTAIKITDQPRNEKACTVLVSPLLPDMDEIQLIDLFKQYGEVKSVLLVRDQTGESKSYGYIVFNELGSAMKALEQGQLAIGEKSLDVLRIHPATQQKADPTTLYVCNFSKQMTKEQLNSYFSPYGKIVSIRLPASRNEKARQFAYIEYEQPSEAQGALAMNGQWNEQENRTWSVAISDPSRRSARKGKENTDSLGSTASTSASCQLFVSNFPRSTEKEELVQLFSQYGGLRDVRILLDTKGKSKGCGFIEYYTHANAQAALVLNDYLIGDRHLSVVTADPNKRGSSHQNKYTGMPANQVSDSHLSGVLRVTRLPDIITEQAVREAFSKYGQLLKVKLFGGGGAMVKYSTDKEANKAVLAMNDYEIVPSHRITVTSAQQSVLASLPSAATTTTTTTATDIAGMSTTSLVPRHLGGGGQSHRRRRLPNISPTGPVSATRRGTATTSSSTAVTTTTTTDENNTVSTSERSNDDFRQLFLQSKSK
ncbi:hypothetical protein BDF19DRAFT_424769 [Syncephalis fuscata]|nr:hypothetical protein BDF19DRAFT_424769 [Syncephalis fuscata]